ncbi:hypothetical protein Tco_1422961 [Tanacetum coccineum]
MLRTRLYFSLMLLRCHRSLRCRYPWRATIRRLRDDGDNESQACDDSDGCVTIAMTKGEIYVECDSVVVCELLLGLRPWHLKSDYWYTIVCDCVGWCRCDEAGLAMMSLLVGRNRDKALCILAWQLTKVTAMAYVFRFSDGLPF